MGTTAVKSSQMSSQNPKLAFALRFSDEPGVSDGEGGVREEVYLRRAPCGFVITIARLGKPETASATYLAPCQPVPLSTNTNDAQA